MYSQQLLQTCKHLLHCNSSNNLVVISQGLLGMQKGSGPRVTVKAIIAKPRRSTKASMRAETSTARASTARGVKMIERQVRCNASHGIEPCGIRTVWPVGAPRRCYCCLSKFTGHCANTHCKCPLTHFECICCRAQHRQNKVAWGPLQTHVLRISRMGVAGHGCVLTAQAQSQL